MEGVWYKRILLSIPSLLSSRTASTAAAALDVGGLEMGVVVGKRVVGLLVPVEDVVVVPVEVVAPVAPVVVVPVVVCIVVVEPDVVVPVVVVGETPSSVYSDPQ